jgi:hypothetical protein
MKAIIIVISVLAVILAGCSSPAPAATTQQTQTQQPLDASPKIGVAPQSLTLEFTEGQTKTTTKTLTILNEGGGVMQWAATKSQPWIWMTEATGALEKGYSKNLDVNIAASGMAVGTYQDNISIEGVGATNSPMLVKVTMVVKAAPVSATDSGSTQVRKAAPVPTWDYNEWTNDTYKLRFRYPKDYVVKSIAGTSFGAVANNGKANSDVIMVNIEGSYGVSYLDTVTEFSKDAIRTLGGKPNPKIITNDNTTMLADGVTPAYELVIDSKSTSTVSYEVYIFGFQKGNRYIFFGACTPITYAADKMALWKEIGHTLEMTN